MARAEGNPFFAEELLAAAGEERRAPAWPARPAAAARSPARPPRAEPAARCRGRRTRRRVPVALRRRRASGTRRARVAAPSGRARRPRGRAGDAELPLPARAPRGGDLRDDPARESARSCTRGSPRSSRAAERRRRRSSHRTGRRRVAATEALAASVDAARQAEAVFGLAEAHAHLERALALWDAVPDAAELAGLDLAELCTWTAELASQIGAAPRARRAGAASDRARRRRRPAPCGAPPCAPRRVPLRDRQQRRRPRRDRARGRARAGGAALARARVCAGVARGGIDGGLAPCGVVADRRAGARARSACRRTARQRFERSPCSACDLAYLGRAEEGLAQIRPSAAARRGDR